MSNSSNRSKEYETVHHITSRIAHKVRFLQEEAERNDLIEMIRRAAVFTGGCNEIFLHRSCGDAYDLPQMP